MVDMLQGAVSALEDLAVKDDFDHMEFQMVTAAIVGVSEEIARVAMAGNN